MDNKKIIVTGANGFIGNYLVNHLRSNDYDVIPFLRRPNVENGEVFYDINGDVNESIIATSKVVIHCAFIPNTNNNSAFDQNIYGTQKLVNLCNKYKIKLIFFSTLSAHSNAESEYGKHKYALENKLDCSKDVILKPGLVIGKGGLFNRMLRFARKFRIIPLIDRGKQPLQFIALSDVAESVVEIINKNLSGSYTLVTNEQMTYLEFYQSISEVYKIRFFYLRIPINPILFFLNTLEKVKINIPVSKENLLGLKNMKFIDSENDMEIVGVRPKKLKDILLDINS